MRVLFNHQNTMWHSCSQSKKEIRPKIKLLESKTAHWNKWWVWEGTEKRGGSKSMVQSLLWFGQVAAAVTWCFSTTRREGIVADQAEDHLLFISPILINEHTYVVDVRKQLDYVWLVGLFPGQSRTLAKNRLRLISCKLKCYFEFHRHSKNERQTRKDQSCNLWCANKEKTLAKTRISKLN